jgi:nitrile hydratase accessory protein
MSDDHDHGDVYDPEKGFHPSCVIDLNRPVFDEDWQRRAFGLAVALSEFGHYPWEAFQKELIGAIGTWQDAQSDSRGRWEYYEHWVKALNSVIWENGLLADGYVMPEDREDGVKHAGLPRRARHHPARAKVTPHDQALAGSHLIHAPPRVAVSSDMTVDSTTQLSRR